MKMKKFLALSTASVMALSMAACGSTDNGGAAESSVASKTLLRQLQKLPARLQHLQRLPA